MVEKRDIGWRLENWSRVVTASGPRVAASQTGAICDRLRRAVEGTAAPSGERRTVDDADAWAIEAGMRELSTKHRILLYWCYIKNARPEIVCNRMGIPSRPATEFVEQFRQAQAAIECIVDRTRGGAVKPLLDERDSAMLRAAARAAGITVVQPLDYDNRFRDVTGAIPHANLAAAPVWDPRKDDGDARRLAEKLGIDPNIPRDKIVQAAAEIGKQRLKNS